MKPTIPKVIGFGFRPRFDRKFQTNILSALAENPKTLLIARDENGRAYKKHIAHAKLYLLSNPDGRTRVIIDSANLSERAFSGNQAETLVRFDDDEEAWHHYSRILDEIRDSASDEIPLPKDRILNAEIEISDTPMLADCSASLVIETPSAEELEVTAPAQVVRVEKVAAVIGPRISAAIPAIRNGRQRIAP